MIERTAQAAMVVILKGDEAERLQYTARHFPRGTENFGHAVNRARLRLKRNFDEVALSQRMGQLQQAASDGNGLEFCFGAAAVFESDCSQNGIT
jgi:hypothetical protein